MPKITVREVLLKDMRAFNNLAQHPMQSWEWGEFRVKTGNKILRLGLYDKSKLVEGYLLTLHRIPYTHKYVAMLAKGPAPTREMLKGLITWAKQENVVFVRIEPDIVITHKNAKGLLKLFAKFKMQTGRKFFNKSTFLIDLTKSPEELLQAMHSKTRYNFKVSQKHGVVVIEDNSKEAFEKYLDLMNETTKRQNYFAHSEKYHRLMWEVLQSAGIAHLLKAVYGGKILACWILFVWKDTLYYPYGSSSSEHKNVMGPYATMWEAIQFGKSLNLKYFDLWGSDDKKGYTKFKEGFGGKNVEFLDTWDLPISRKLYYTYRIAEELRWKFLKAKGKLFPNISSFR